MPHWIANRYLAAASAALLAFTLAMVGPPLSPWSSYAQTASAQNKQTSAAQKKWSAKTEPAGSGGSRAEQSIMVLVNDEPITAYEIDQRARFIALNANVSEQAKERFQQIVKADSTNAQLRALQEEVIRNNPGKSREQLVAIFSERQKQFALGLQKQALDGARSALLPRLKKDAQEELIDERLKLQEAKRLGIEVSDDDVKGVLKNLADRNKMTYDQFAQHLKGMGVNIATMGERFRGQIAWRQAIQRRYSAQISVTQGEIDRVLSSAAIEAGEDTVELQVYKIALPLPGKVDQTAMAKRFVDAENLRRKFSGCKSMGELAKTVADARFEDMKFVKPGSIAEPTRSMLLSAKDGDMLPPSTTGAGVEIFAVCSRRSISSNDAQRAKAKEELQLKEIDVLARRHMRNIRQDAAIEYR